MGSAGNTATFRTRIKELLRGESDLVAPDQRGRERFRRVVLSASAMAVAKAIGMAATLLTVPFTAPYLGPERFGLFMTLGAIPLLMSFSDFGIGNGLITELAKATGREDRTEVRTLVSSAFFILLAIAVLIVIISAGLCAYVPWARLLGVMSPEGRAETAPALFVFLACTALSMPLGVVQHVQRGFQESYAPNLWLALGNLLSLVLLLSFVHLGLGLAWLVGAIAGGPVISGIANWLTQFVWMRPWLAPRPALIRRSSMGLILHTGLLIFSSQAGSAILLGCPAFLLAHAGGAKTVAPFSVLQRLYSVFVVASSMLMTPLWPAYSEAHARGDFDWVRTTFFRSVTVNAAIVGVPLFLLALWSPRLTSLFTKGSIEATLPLGLATALMCFLMATRHCVTMMVNGCGYLRRTAIAFPLGALIAVSYAILPWKSPGDYWVPLWVSGAETVVLCGVFLDVTRVLRSESEVKLEVLEDVEA